MCMKGNMMTHLIRHAALAALLALAAGGASAAATVTYVQPERFSDIPFAHHDRERVLDSMTDHFNKLAARLPAGQDLNVEVLDIDLAGQSLPSRMSAQDLRVMNGGADWPRIKLRYSITQGGQVVRSGEENLRDMTYLDHPNRFNGSDLLRYEKKMLDDWFKERLAVR